VVDPDPNKLYTQKKAVAEEQGASHDVLEQDHDCAED